MDNFRKIAFLILVIVFLEGCSNSVHSVSVQITSTAAVENTPTKTVQSTRTIPATNTIISSTLTPSAVPTVSSEEAYAGLQKFLHGDCSLPCVGGLIPGISKPEDAYILLEPLSSIAKSDYLKPNEEGAVNYNHAEKDRMIDVGVAYRIDPASRSISVIIIDSSDWMLSQTEGPTEAFDAEALKTLMTPYRIQNIFSLYGPPANILVWVDEDFSNAQKRGFFDITVLYPDKGFFITYESAALFTNTVARGCPDKAFIKIYAIKPINDLSYNELLTKADGGWAGNILSVLSIQDASSTSPIEFYKAVLRNPGFCLESPLDHWHGP